MVTLVFATTSLLLIAWTLSRRRGRTREGIDRYGKQNLVLGSQVSLQNNSCLIIGCGGLATGCLPLLAGSGVGRIGIVDSDVVSVSNLHRQTIYTEEQVGLAKVHCAKQFVSRLNSQVQVETFCERIVSVGQLEEIAENFQYLIDCCDNAETRYIVNRVAIIQRKVLVSASAVGTTGQLALFHPPLTACYRCIFPRPLQDPETCSSEGVLGPVPTILGALQALETIKAMSGLKLPVNDCVGRMLVLDLSDLRIDPVVSVEMRRLENCPDCSSI